MATRSSRTHDVRVSFRARTGSIGAEYLKSAASFALQAEGVRHATISIAIVDDEEIHSLNRTWLRHDYPTDIITFPLEENPLEAELVISADTARRQGREYGVPLREELARLVIHGILHLTGYDDTSEAAKTRMKKQEDEQVARFTSRDRTRS